MTIVSRLMKDAGLKDPASVIDRAHRIGRTYINNGNRCKSIIVKFNNFRVRTAFYRKRKSLTDTNVRIRVDLTKERYNFLRSVLELISNRNINNVYAFAEINCRIKLYDVESGESQFIESLEDATFFLAKSNY